MPYERKLTIPKDLYYKGSPATVKIWPAIFSDTVEHDDRQIRSTIEGDNPTRINKTIKKTLVSFGAKYVLTIIGQDYQKLSKIFGKRQNWENWKIWKIVPYHTTISTIADKYNSIMWNVPTLNPEYIYQCPSKEILKHKIREFEIWKILTNGMTLYPYDLGIAYCHIIDYLCARAPFLE